MGADTNQPPSTRVRKRLRAVHRELLSLAVLIVIAVAGFLFTRAVAAGNERIRKQDAAAWYATGERELTAGRTTEAVVALRRATSKTSDEKNYVLGLATALVADDQAEAARQVLERLRDVAPEDVDVNLGLARLEAQRGDFDRAVRYYQNALNGLWGPDQREARRRQRTELIRLLLAHDQRSRALSELLVANADLPGDPASQAMTGRLFLDAGDARRALDHFARALAVEPQNAQALAGAGASAFALGDYARARRYLAAAPDGLARMGDLRMLTDLVLANDPMAPRLGLAQRTIRLAAAFHQAADRLAACLARPPSDSVGARADLAALQRDVEALEPALAPQAIREAPDAIESGVELIYRVEKGTEKGCAAPAPIDRALLLIGQRHGFDER